MNLLQCRVRLQDRAEKKSANRFSFIQIFCPRVLLRKLCDTHMKFLLLYAFLLELFSSPRVCVKVDIY